MQNKKELIKNLLLHGFKPVQILDFRVVKRHFNPSDVFEVICEINNSQREI